MGRIMNSSDCMDASMLHKSRLEKNFKDDNYWIESYQNKINKAWNFATDVADITEQKIEFKDNTFLNPYSPYTNEEVRITSAYDEKGVKLSDDYKNIIFKDVNHKLRLGTKYIFDVRDFENNTNPSTWLSINFDTVHVGSNTIIRRCSANIGMLVKDNSIEYYEPVIVDYDPKYTINYFQQALNTVKSELYLTLQFNDYTRHIDVNDRFILGYLNEDNKSQTHVYKVKEVFKLGSLTTDDPNDVPLLQLALDRDVYNSEVDYIHKDENGVWHYIADYNNKANNIHDDPENPKEEFDYNIVLDNKANVIHAGQEETYTIQMYKGSSLSSGEFIVSASLDGCQYPEKYFEFEIVDEKTFKIKCIKKYLKKDLRIDIIAKDETSGIILDEYFTEVLLDAEL